MLARKLVVWTTHPNIVSLLERALPESELAWEWWTESMRSPFEKVNTVLFIYVFFTQISASLDTFAHEDLGGVSPMDTCRRPRHVLFCDTLHKNPFSCSERCSSLCSSLRHKKSWKRNWTRSRLTSCTSSSPRATSSLDTSLSLPKASLLSGSLRKW